MSESKKARKSKTKKSAKEDAQPETETVAEVVEVEIVSNEEYEALKQQFEESEAKAAENLDGWLRSQADFANYKKRIERDRSANYQTMKGDIAKRFLPVIDDLERALQNAPEDPWVEGIELIYRKLQGILEAEGITRIEAEGAEFDPNFHEAIAQAPSDEYESGHVIEVVQQGYMLAELVIRPAMVLVAE
ncbi:MAG: nucleotide exchange factor GrpE [Anaerolinea sp. 4484_236]|nr:MAG: nucleotide exchange factor GrpE [Anaerolinea sp. 4484_236]